MNVEAQTHNPAAVLGASEWIRERAWIVLWSLGGRATVLAVALVVGVVGPRGYLRADERSQAFGLLGAWDGRWYRIIASHGYLLIPGRQSDPAFFPLFPLLLRAVHAVGLGYETAGLLISNVAFFAALVAFNALSRELFGQSFARRATVYLAIFPLGYVFSMSYPEAVVLGALAVAAGGAARVNFQDARLHQRDQAGEIVERYDLVALFGDQMQVFGGDAGGMLLKETLSGRALRAAQQRDRPPDDMRAHPFPNLRIELGKIALADAGVFPIDAVGMA